MPEVTVGHDTYLLGDVLGRGAHGVVYRGIHATSGLTVAVKQFVACSSGVVDEVRLLKSLHDPHIVQYHGSHQVGRDVYLVMEYCENGSLQSICKAVGTFPERLLSGFVGQVLSGLSYLHAQGVVHRDVKAANILTTKAGQVKLADFGVSGASGPGDAAGSPYWMAPEVIDLQGATPASDIWSLGSTIYELLTGQPPLHDLDSVAAMYRIANGDAMPTPVASGACLDFLDRCWQRLPALRPSAETLSRHPWLQQDVKVVAAMAQVAAFHERLDREEIEDDWTRDFEEPSLSRFDRRELDVPDDVTHIGESIPAAPLRQPLQDQQSSADEWPSSPVRSTLEDRLKKDSRRAFSREGKERHRSQGHGADRGAGSESRTLVQSSARARHAPKATPRRSVPLAKYRDEDDFEEGLELHDSSLQRPRTVANISSDFDSFEADSMQRNVSRVHNARLQDSSASLVEQVRSGEVTAETLARTLDTPEAVERFLQARGMIELIARPGFAHLAVKFADQGWDEFVALGGPQAAIRDGVRPWNLAELFEQALRGDDVMTGILPALQTVSVGVQTDLIRVFVRRGGFSRTLQLGSRALSHAIARQQDVPLDAADAALALRDLRLVRYLTQWPEAASALDRAGVWGVLRSNHDSVCIVHNLLRLDQRRAARLPSRWLASAHGNTETLLSIYHIIASTRPRLLDVVKARLDDLLSSPRWHTQAAELALKLGWDVPAAVVAEALERVGPLTVSVLRALRARSALGQRYPGLGDRLLTLSEHCDPAVAVDCLRLIDSAGLAYTLTELLRRHADGPQVVAAGLAKAILSR